VAKLLLSALATDSLSEVDERTRKLAAVRSASGKCPLTGESRFLGAIEHILSDSSLAEAVITLNVHRQDNYARIGFKDADPLGTWASEWGRRSDMALPGIYGLRTIAQLLGPDLKSIAIQCEDLGRLK
jgi:hypothetical protein